RTPAGSTRASPPVKPPASRRSSTTRPAPSSSGPTASSPPWPADPSCRGCPGPPPDWRNPHVHRPVPAAGRGLPYPGRRQARRPPEDAPRRPALRHRLAAVPAHRRRRTGRRGRCPRRTVLAAAGMIVLLIGALVTHRRAHDSVREALPAVLALVVSGTYLAVAQ